MKNEIKIMKELMEEIPELSKTDAMKIAVEIEKKEIIKKALFPGGVEKPGALEAIAMQLGMKDTPAYRTLNETIEDCFDELIQHLKDRN